MTGDPFFASFASFAVLPRAVKLPLACRAFEFMAVVRGWLKAQVARGPKEAKEAKEAKNGPAGAVTGEARGEGGDAVNHLKNARAALESMHRGPVGPLLLASAWCERTGCKPEVFVDATGVGAPVMDLLREQAPEVRSAVAVLFTAGSGKKPHRSKRQLTLGKARLVSRLQALLRVGRLHLPKTREAEALARELLTYEIRVDDNGHARFGAFKVGTHNDLVTALGLAVHQEQGSP